MFLNSGEHNVSADMLSRITDFAELPARSPLDRRLILDLEQLWFRRSARGLQGPFYSSCRGSWTARKQTSP